MKTKRIIISVFIGLLILTLSACGKPAKTEAPKYIEINDVVKEAFLTDKGFSNELSKHLTMEVFDKINIYNTYPANSPEFKKPFSVDFSLAETSQKKDGNTIKVEMIYSVIITDSNFKTIGGSREIPITFTVKLIDGSWIITHKEEQP